MMNEKKPKWLCPVCNKPALFKNLHIDGYFKEVIADTKLPTDNHEIVLHNDGTWEAMPSPKQQEEDKQKERKQKIKREKARVAKKALKVPETLNIDDDDNDNSNGTASSIECVSLDSDSDEDDSTSLSILPPPSKRINTMQHDVHVY
jgi:hypothetical protein